MQLINPNEKILEAIFWLLFMTGAGGGGKTPVE